MRFAANGSWAPIAFWGLLTICPVLADLPSLPDSFVRTGRADASGTTWRESGEMRLSLSNAVEALKVSFAAQGYAFAHDIAAAPAASRRILFWTGATNDILAMVWRMDSGKTGVRWGVSAHGESSPAAGSAGGKPLRAKSTKVVSPPFSPARSASADGASSTKTKTQKEQTP